jgi:type II secretory pathway pseudopilin PulG
MGVKINKGFTIIELVLFLGITGLVMGVLLAGVGGSLNRERYRDAVSSFQNYLQGQYNLVNNVNNSRDATEICSGGKIIADATGDSGRGTSDCTIVGRVIYSSADGESLTSAQVYATVDASTLAGDNDVQVLNDAKLTASPHLEPFTPGWSTRIVDPKPDDAISVFSILIVRMPTNGLVHTYAVNQTNAKPAAIVGNQIPTTGLHMCVDNSMFTATGVGRVGVTLARDAVNSSGVQFASEDQC